MIGTQGGSSSIKARIIGISKTHIADGVPLQFSLAKDWKQEQRVFEDQVTTIIGGNFKSLEFSEYEGEYGIRKNFNLTLTDQENGDIILGCGVNNLGLNILNSMLSADTLDEIRLSLYMKDGKDGNSYPNVAINNSLTVTDGSTLLGWSLTWEEQQSFVEVTKNSKGKVVESDRDGLFEELKNRLIAKGFGNEKGQQKVVPNDNTPKVEAEDPDSLPF